VEPTGLGTILHVRPFGATVKAFTLNRDATAVGDTVAIRLPAERLHLFDAQSGQRVS
jgi:multiple sugar transport system ATP-binding protein